MDKIRPRCFVGLRDDNALETSEVVILMDVKEILGVEDSGDKKVPESSIVDCEVNKLFK